MATYGEIVKIFTPLQISKINIQSKKCKWKSCSELTMRKFILRPSAAKITHYNKKCFK